MRFSQFTDRAVNYLQLTIDFSLWREKQVDKET